MKRFIIPVSHFLYIVQLFMSNSKKTGCSMILLLVSVFQTMFKAGMSAVIINVVLLWPM